VRDAGRTHRELQVVQDDIASAEKGRLALEDKDCELETKLVTKLEDLGKLALQCNQAHKRYERAWSSISQQIE
jgi:kinetochore protein NDC80